MCVMAYVYPLLGLAVRSHYRPKNEGWIMTFLLYCRQHSVCKMFFGLYLPSDISHFVVKRRQRGKERCKIPLSLGLHANILSTSPIFLPLLIKHTLLLSSKRFFSFLRHTFRLLFHILF